MEFRNILEASERNISVVLVSKDDTHEPKISTSVLSRQLAGTALVVEIENRNVDEELEHCIGRSFGCRNGAIRVYFPGVRFDSPSDSKRHRFFLRADIDSLGAEKVQELIANGVCRRTPVFSSMGIFTIEEIQNTQRSHRLNELRLRIAESNKRSDEWVSLVEEENAELIRQNDAITADKIQLECEFQQIKDDLEISNNDVQRLEYEKYQIQSRCETANISDSLHHLRSKLSNHPNSLAELLELFQAMFPDRLDFTKQAVDSVKDVSCQDITIAWQALYHMATTLYDLFFCEENIGKDYELEFQRISGHRLAMTEGRQTKRDKKLMKMREDTYNSITINITPHVKFDKDSIRAYFCPYSDEKTKTRRIVIGYMGHLKTDGTRRRKN